MNEHGEIKAPCPLCGGSIVVTNGYWKCPCCSYEMHSWDPFAICGSCKFPPYYYTCPHCGDEFPLYLLLGEGPGVCQKRPDFGDRGSKYKLVDLQLYQPPDMVQDAGWASAIKAIIPHIDQVEFTSPCEIRSHVLLSGARSADGRCWLHFSLYADEVANEEARVGQVSLTASRTGQEPTIASVVVYPAYQKFTG